MRHEMLWDFREAGFSSLPCGCQVKLDSYGSRHSLFEACFIASPKCLYQHGRFGMLQYAIHGVKYSKEEWEEEVRRRIKEVFELLEAKIIKCYILCDYYAVDDRKVSTLFDEITDLQGEMNFDNSSSDAVFSCLSQLKVDSKKWHEKRRSHNVVEY